MAPPDPLAELRERVRATQEAAERLAGERAAPRESQDELDALVGILRSLRDLVPPELQQQVTEVLRQVLLILRALIDYWVARLQPPSAAPSGDAEPQDIPVD